MRKKVYIAARKAPIASAASAEIDETRPDESTSYSPSPKAQVPIPRLSPARPSFEQDDLTHDRETLIDFLMNGGSEGRSDEEVWECLNRQVSIDYCLVAAMPD